MARLARLARLAVGLALCPIAHGCGSPAELNPNLVLITIDTLRRDRLACYGGPDGVGTAICHLADSGVRYSWAFSPSPFTTVAIASILTSRYPSRHGVTAVASSALPSRAVTLAEALRSGGYATGAFVGSQSLNRSRNLQQGFDIYQDRHPASPVSSGPKDLATPRRTAASLTRSALEFAKGAEQPWFIWIHYGEPRGPYAPLQAGSSATQSAANTSWRSAALMRLADHSGRGGVPAYQAPVEAAEPRAIASGDLLRRYDAEIRRVDQQIGRLVEGLDALGHPGVLITADHGEALGEDDYWFAHGHSLGLDQIRVPLVWRAPRKLDDPAPFQRGRIVREAVSTLDVAPTLLAAAKLPRPATFTGVPLDGGPAVRAQALARRIFAEHPLRIAVIHNGLYYARDRNGFDQPVRDRIRGGELHPLPARFAILRHDGSQTPYRTYRPHRPAAQATTPPGRKPALAVTDAGGAISSLEASLAEFVSDTQLGLDSERLDAQSSSPSSSPSSIQSSIPSSIPPSIQMGAPNGDRE